MGLPLAPAYDPGRLESDYRTPLSYWIHRRLYEDEHLSIEGLAEFARVSRSTGYAWFSGSTGTPRETKLLLIAQYIGVHSSLLAPGASPDPHADVNLNEIDAPPGSLAHIMILIGARA